MEWNYVVIVTENGKIYILIMVGLLEKGGNWKMGCLGEVGISISNGTESGRQGCGQRVKFSSRN